MPSDPRARFAAALGLRLAELRARAGLTAAELAGRLGVAQPRVSEWEAGRRCPSSETLARLALALGVSLKTFDDLRGLARR